jgi:hypothetical protein
MASCRAFNTSHLKFLHYSVRSGLFERIEFHLSFQRLFSTGDVPAHLRLLAIHRLIILPYNKCIGRRRDRLSNSLTLLPPLFSDPRSLVLQFGFISFYAPHPSDTAIAISHVGR